MIHFLQARTEITITPVVNTSAQSHSNDLIQVVNTAFFLFANTFFYTYLDSLTVTLNLLGGCR